MDCTVYINVFKPLFDRIGSLFLLLLVFPFIAFFSLFIALTMGRPVFFAQRRPGLHGKIFTIYKLRTMTDERDENGELLPDAQRLKGIGKWIRSLSLDELPQLWNVLKGEMSFIGPRPLLVEYLDLYTPEQSRRHDVRPGITGWAQVNGRNAISWEEKFRYDVEYVERISFGLDLRILWLTIRKVIHKEGISQEGEATMEKFRGSH